MNFEQLYAPSLKELFVQKLQGMILSGELPMGEKLPSERELCQQMGVSRAVVNGGITELARQGFLEVRPRQGAYVADYRRDGNMETLNQSYVSAGPNGWKHVRCARENETTPVRQKLPGPVLLFLGSI